MLGQLGQAAHAEQAEHRADGQAPRVRTGARVVVLLVTMPTVDEQRNAGAGRGEREQDAGPTGQQREGGVGAAADRAELTAP